MDDDRWHVLRCDNCPVPSERATCADDVLEAIVRRADGQARFYGDWRLIRTLFWDQDDLDDQVLMAWIVELIQRREVVIVADDPTIGWGMEPGAPVLYIQHPRRFARFQDRRPIPVAVRRAVMERDEHTCQLCGATDALSLDHIVPFSRGGLDTIENLRVLCRLCNSRRGNRV